MKIDPAALEAYARQIPIGEVRQTAALNLPDSLRDGQDLESCCAYLLTLNAVNFGSGYFPELNKRPGHSGFRTIEACLLERFETRGLIPVAELSGISPEQCQQLFEQTPASAGASELMALFSVALNDLGRAVGGSFEAYARGWGGSARSAVRALLEMPLYRDVSELDGKSVPFLKRAQITVSDIASLPGAPFRFDDLGDLTLFADNLVPHVLRLDGVLVFDPELRQRIESETALAWNSREEIEIRAAAVHATECLAQKSGLQPRELDAWLWTRGSGTRYKAVPRHRAPCPFY